MEDKDLPQRAKPESLYSICRFSKGKEEVRSSEVYSSIDDNKRTLRRTLGYGDLLGFLERDGGEFTLTSRGSGLGYQPSFEKNSAVHELFREAIEDYKPYRETLLKAYEQQVEATVLGNRVLEQSSLKRLAEEITGQEVENREINLLIKTADAAGLGTFKAGKKGYETRLVLSEDYESFLSSLSEKYTLPKIQEKESDQEEEVSQKTDEESVEGSEESGGLVKLTIELDVNEKSEEEIANIVQRIRGME